MQGEIEYHTKERVTIKDISAKLGISSTTVHRALAGKEGMTDELRDKILQTAREMGYEINYAASCILTSSFICNRLQNIPFIPFILTGKNLNIYIQRSRFFCLFSDAFPDIIKISVLF